MQGGRCRKVGCRRSGSRPRVEALEDRTLLSNVSWISSQSGNWDTAANWSTGQVPTSADAVTINVSGVTVTVETGNQSALSVQVASGSTLALANGNLTLGAASEIDGGLTLGNSTLTLGGTLALKGTTQWNDSGFFNLNGDTLSNQGTMTLAPIVCFGQRLLASTSTQGGTVVNEGTITEQGVASLGLYDGVEVDNTAQGSYVFAGDGSLTDNGGNCFLVNAGTIDKASGTGSSSLTVAFNNTGGTLEVDSGTLTLAGGPTGALGTSTGGTFTVAANATLDLTGGSSSHVFTGSYTGSGAGTVLLQSGTLDIGTGGATFNLPAGQFQWTGGYINLQGNALTNAGTMTLGSTTTNTTEGLETRSSAGSLLAGGTLLNTGTIVQQGVGTLSLYDAAAVNNQGSYQLTGAGTINSSSGALVASFDNAGTLAMTAATDTFTMTATLNNSGTTEATSGTLALQNYVNNTGLVLADGAAVTLSGPTDGGELIGCQWVARGGGTLTLPGGITASQTSLTLDGANSTIAGLSNLAANAGTITVTNGASLSTSVGLDNRGTITVGPASTFSIGGSYTQEAAGTLDVLLGGAPAGGQFGTLAATGSMTLGGVLRAEVVGGYSPTVGDSFTVATSTGSSGAFAAVVLPATTTVAFGAAVNANSIVLTAQAATATPTTTRVASSRPGRATYGQSITFTATVAPSSGSGTPTGTVQFQIDGVNVGSPVTLTGGSATPTTTLAVGQHTVAALYLSNTPQFADSEDAGSPLAQAVNPGPSTTAPNTTLFYTVGGSSSTGSVNNVAINYTGSGLTVGAPITITATPGDGLMFLPNDNLLFGGNSVTELTPTGTVVGTVSQVGDHLALGPSGTTAWTSAETGSLVAISLPSLSAVTHTVSGDDNGVTQVAFDPSGNAYYTDSSFFGTGDFGTIDLKTFTTKRLFSSLPAAHGLSYDPYTGDLILFGAGNITQFDPRTLQIVSSRQVGGRLDQGSVDGKGHLYAADNNGNLIFLDYSATHLVGDARNFVGPSFLASNLDDFAALSGLGALPSHFGLTVSANPVTAGQTFSITVSALDNLNHVVSDYAATVHFTSTDPNAVLPADYTFTAADHGKHTFTGVILKKAGTRTITVTDTAYAFLTGKKAVTVTAAAASHLSIIGPSSATAGSPFTITVTALDPYNNVATSYLGTIHFTSSDTQAVLPADYTFVAGDNGKHTFTNGVTLNTAGTQSVTATDTQTNTIKGKKSITVGAAPPSRASGPRPSAETGDAAASSSATAGALRVERAEPGPSAAAAAWNPGFLHDNGEGRRSNGMPALSAKRAADPDQTWLAAVVLVGEHGRTAHDRLMRSEDVPGLASVQGIPWDVL
jgi:hypothetical protein